MNEAFATESWKNGVSDGMVNIPCFSRLFW